MCLSTIYGEITHTGLVISKVGMATNQRRDTKMFLASLPKVSCRFTNVFLITLQPVTLVPIGYSTLLCNGVLVLRGNKGVFDGVSSFKINMDSHFRTYVFKMFTEPLGVRYHHMIFLSLLLLLTCFGCGCYTCGCI